IRIEPSRRVESDLFAKALALEDSSGNRLVLITVDLVAMPIEISRQVAKLVSDRIGLPREQLLLAASHTHCGPEIRPDKVLFFKIPPEFAAKIEPAARKLAATLIDLIGAALADLRPARLIARRATASFAHNRRAGNEGVDHDVPI